MVHYWWAFCCILARCCGTPRGGGGGGMRLLLGTDRSCYGEEGDRTPPPPPSPKNPTVCCNMTFTEGSGDAARPPTPPTSAKVDALRFFFLFFPSRVRSLLRKSIAINLQPTLHFPMRQKRVPIRGVCVGGTCLLVASFTLSNCKVV